MKKQIHWTVYILKCSDGTYYSGCTNNLKGRIYRHNKGMIHFTKTRLPVEVITFVVFDDKYKAYNFEKYLKTGSGIAFAKKRLR